MIPPTRYIDAGPGMPLANPQSAMAEAQAYANLGETIQQVGQVGFQYAERIRKIDEAGKISALEANMNEDAAKFSIELMKREDTANWPGEWKERSAKWLDEAKKQGLSPDGMARFQERFTQWNSQRTIGFEMTAANKAIELGRARIANSYDYFLGQQDWDGAARTLQDGRDAGIFSTPEYDKAMMDLGQRQQHAGMLEDMTANPREWAESHPIDQPPAGYSQEKWWQMHDHARGLARREDIETTDNVVDGIVTGNISTPEQLEAATPNMRPGARQKLHGFLADYHDANAKALRETPEFQHEVVGRVSDLLKEYNPEREDYDEKFVEMATQVEQLPAGAVRDELTRRINAAREGGKVEIKTRKDAALREIDVIDEAGGFGKVAPARKIEVREKVKDGFLKDVPKLQALGFSEDQAQTIREAAAEDPALGQKKFQELWKEKPQGSVNAAPFDIALADALKNGDGFMNWEMDGEASRMDAEKAARLRAKGKAITELEEWFKVNPDAKEPEIMGKLREMGSQAARLAPATGVVKPAPGRKIDPSTSMNLPEGGIKLSNYGYKSDTTPDSFSAAGIGHRNNKLIPGESAAISKSLATRLGLKHGDKVKVETTKGAFTVFYHDTVPSYDKRTGPLPETIDIYRPKDGSNSWGGRVLNISKVS